MPISRTSGNKIPLGAEQEAAPTSGSPALGEMDTVLKGSGLGRLDIKELRKRARHPVPSSPLSLSNFQMGSGRNIQEVRLRYHVRWSLASRLLLTKQTAELRSSFLNGGESTTSSQD